MHLRFPARLHILRGDLRCDGVAVGADSESRTEVSRAARYGRLQWNIGAHRPVAAGPCAQVELRIAAGLLEGAELRQRRAVATEATVVAGFRARLGGDGACVLPDPVDEFVDRDLSDV